MTPRELRDEVAVAEAMQRDESVRDLALAWHVATFGIAAYVGKLPELSTLVNRLRAPAPGRLTPEAQRTQVALLSEYMGVSMRPISEEAKQALLRMRES